MVSGKIHVPVLYLYGQHDEIIPAGPAHKAMSLMKASNKMTRTAVYPNGWHMLMRDKGNSEGWGLSQDELVKILDDDYQPANEMERACFDYVRTASATPDSVPMEILGRLKKHLTPPQIVELACVVGFWKFYNTVHDSLHIPVEEHLLNDTRYVDV